MACPIVWFEALGQHGDKLHSFYGEVLGWRFDAKRAAQAPSAHPSARLRGARRAEEPHREPLWWVTYYTRVPDLDAAIEKARSLGSRVLVAPTRMGGSTIAVVSDPAGHPVGLCS
ncbi:MAG TPA: VOC family protein [Myxococcota bacterium]